MSADILSCLFCGGEMVRQKTPDRLWYRECAGRDDDEGCGYRTSSEASDAEAIAAHNTIARAEARAEAAEAERDALRAQVGQLREALLAVHADTYEQDAYILAVGSTVPATAPDTRQMRWVPAYPAAEIVDARCRVNVANALADAALAAAALAAGEEQPR